MMKAALLVVLVLGCGSVTAREGVDGAAGAGGGAPDATGGAGELGGRGGQAATNGTGGESIGVLTAPTCPPNMGAADQQNCGEITNPSSPSDQRNCSVGCAPTAGEPCNYDVVTYCVRSCSECRF